MPGATVDVDLSETTTGRALLVSAAGPAANLMAAGVLPVVCYALWAWIGVTEVPPVVGHVSPGTSTAEAGLHEGDLIVQINDVTPSSWAEVEAAQTGPVHVVVTRGTSTIEVDLPENAWLVASRLTPTLALTHDSPLRSAGALTGDQITHVDGEAVHTYAALVSTMATRRSVDLARSDAPAITARRAPDQDWGLVSPDLIIGNSMSPKSDLRQGDRLLTVDGVPIQSFAQLRRAVLTSEGRDIDLLVERQGAPHAATMMPFRGLDEGWRLGVGLMPGVYVNPTATIRRGPVTGLAWAVDRSSEFWREARRDLAPTRTFTGPLVTTAPRPGLAELAVISFALWSAFLAVWNLLPLPYSDLNAAAQVALARLTGRQLPLQLANRVGCGCMLSLAWSSRSTSCAG
jgi:regulator of sigma E protease